MRATNLNYLTIIEKKDQMSHWIICIYRLLTVLCLHFLLSLLWVTVRSLSDFDTISLRKILNLLLFHRVNVRIMDISDISGEGGFIQWKSASWQTLPPYHPEILQKNKTFTVRHCPWSYTVTVCARHHCLFSLYARYFLKLVFLLLLHGSNLRHCRAVSM